MAISQKVDWIVVGGQGQLSLSMQAVLSARGESFFAPSREVLDVTNFSQVADSLHAFRPKVVFNGAAWTDVEGAEEHEEEATLVNAKAVENLAITCVEISATLIHISTDYVFSGLALGEYAEDESPSAISAYGRSKALGEKAILAVPNLNSYIVRTAWLYGSEGRNFAKTILRKAVFTNEVINVVSDQYGQPTFTGDLAARIYSMTEEGLPFGTYHGTNGGRASWYDFAVEIFRLAGANVERVIPIPSSAYPSKVQRPMNSVLSHEKWSAVGATPMRDWQSALHDAMPSLLHAIKMEE